MQKKLATPICLVALFTLALPYQALANEDESATSILKKSNEAMFELESYSSETHIEMTMMGMGEEVTIKMDSKEDVILEPFAMHQTVTTSMAGEEETLETYWTEEGFYQETADGEWVKLPMELSDGLDELMEWAMASDQVEQAELFGDDMSVEDNGDSYILTYEGDGQDLEEAMKEWMDMSMGQDEDMMMEELMADITYNDVKYEMTIEKDTHYMTNLMMHMDMDMEVEGETTNMTQKIEMDVHNFNGVDSIEVPADVRDNAQMLDEMEGGALPDTASNNPMLVVAGGLITAIGVFLFARRKTAHASV
ncbi:LPXTG cell wall anchor domain-containing protein [Alkalihalobacillus sp. FSL R5-0424]